VSGESPQQAHGKTYEQTFEKQLETTLQPCNPILAMLWGLATPLLSESYLYGQTEPPGKHRGVHCSRGVSRLNLTHPRYSAVLLKSKTERLGKGEQAHQSKHTLISSMSRVERRVRKNFGLQVSSAFARDFSRVVFSLTLVSRQRQAGV